MSLRLQGRPLATDSTALSCPPNVRHDADVLQPFLLRFEVIEVEIEKQKETEHARQKFQESGKDEKKMQALMFGEDGRCRCHLRMVQCMYSRVTKGEKG